MTRKGILRFCLLLAFLAGTPFLAHAQDADELCQEAAQLIAAGELDQAEKLYDDALEASENATCALDGKREVACKRAEGLLENGWVALAEEKYVKILEGKKDEACAKAGMDRVRDAYCQQGDKLLAGGEVAKAEAKYNKALEISEDGGCAPDGLSLVRIQYCHQAGALVAAGKIDEAKAKYEELLKSDPSLVCARNGLKRIPSEYDKAEALQQSGMDDKAWTQLEEAIKADPSDQNRYELANQLWAWLQRQFTRVEVYLNPIASGLKSLVIGLAILLILIFLIRLFRRMRRNSQQLKLDVDKFKLGSLDLEKDPSDVLVARVERALQRLGEEDKPNRPGVIDKSLEPPELPADLASVPKEVNVVWDLMTKLYPANTITLSGVLQHHKRRGAGLSLRLVHEPTSELLGTQTIWQRDFNPAFSPSGEAPTAADYFQLAEPAAVWTYWQLQQCIHCDDWVGGTQKPQVVDLAKLPKLQRRLRRVFGTDKWESYACHRVAKPFMDDNKAAAERILRQALALDSQDRHSLFNLAMMVIEQVSPEDAKKALDADPGNPKDPYEEPKRYLDQVKDYSDKLFPKAKAANSGETEATHNAKAGTAQSGEAEAAHSAEAVHIFADYQLGAVELYKYILAKEKEPSYLTEAKECLRKAVADAKGSAAITEAVRHMLEIAYQNARLLDGDPTPRPDDKIKEIEDQIPFAPWIPYNLACYYSTPKDLLPTNLLPTYDARLDKALAHLKGALKAIPAWAVWAREDPSLKTLRDVRPDEFSEIAPPEKKPEAVVFSLPAAKVRSDLSAFKPGDNKITVILAVKNQDAETGIVAHASQRYDDATLIDLRNKDGIVSPPPYKKPPYEQTDTVRISLPLDAKGTAVQFAAHLADATDLYLVAPREKEPALEVCELPGTQIKSDLSSLKPGDGKLAVALVVESRDTRSGTVTHASHRYGGATLLDVLDANGEALFIPYVKPPYEQGQKARVVLPFASKTAEKQFDDHLKEASDIYLLPPPGKTLAPAVFSLPAEKIKSDISIFEPHDKGITVLLTVKSKDAEGEADTPTLHRYEGATLIDWVEKGGHVLPPPYGLRPYQPTNAVRISLPLDAKGTAVEFAAHLADAIYIYLFPPPQRMRTPAVSSPVARDPQCDPVQLHPTGGPFADVPAYEGASQPTDPYTLEASNDPMDYRCSLAWVFDDDLAGGAEWKHYVAPVEAEEACQTYKPTLTFAGWWPLSGGCAESANYLLYHAKSPYLLVLFLSREGSTDVLVGRQKDTD